MDVNWKKFFSSPWIVALGCLGIFFLTHGYRFAWDDHSHEVPLLKSFIDPELYPRDFFIQGLRANQPTYFFKGLALFLKMQWIEPAYFILFCISRYFLFFWMYKFWAFIAKDKFLGLIGVLGFLILIREEMFLNLTFSHTEFTIPAVFAALFYFYSNRFYTSAIILGLATNLHAIYGMFVMMYIVVYQLLSLRRYGINTLLKTVLIYSVCALPFLWHYIGVVFYNATQSPLTVKEWEPLFRKYASYLYIYGHDPLSYTFRKFPTAVTAMSQQIYLCLLYLLNVCHNQEFRQNKKNHAVFLTAVIAVLVSFLAGYVFPNKFLLTLSLPRHQEFLKVILTGFTTIWFFKCCRTAKPWQAGILSFLFLIVGDKTIFSMLAIIMVVFMIYARKSIVISSRLWRYVACGVCVVMFLGAGYMIYFVHSMFRLNPFSSVWIQSSVVLIIFLIIISYVSRLRRWRVPLCRLIMCVPILVMFVGYGLRVYAKTTRPKTALEHLRGDFRKMAEFVRKNTDKDALFLIPYDMPFHGFRIFSERSLVVSAGDGGIVFFNLPATRDFEQRLKAVQNFKISPTQQELRQIPFDIRNAVIGYGVDYVVFPALISPLTDKYLAKVKTTDFLVLYQVRR